MISDISVTGSEIGPFIIRESKRGFPKTAVFLSGMVFMIERYLFVRALVRGFLTVLFVSLSCLLTPAWAENDGERDVAFHFYGAFDCPPCMAFKRDGLPVVEASGEELGFTVRANLIEKTRNVATPGAYGEADPLLREAGLQMDRVYPPVFFVTRKGEIHSVHGHDWEEALKTVQSLVR